MTRENITSKFIENETCELEHDSLEHDSLDTPEYDTRRKVTVTFGVSQRQERALTRAAELLEYPKAEMFRVAIDYLIERLHVKFPRESCFEAPGTDA